MDTTNEPVAWMNPESLECGHGGNVDWEDTGCIPLYTHPAKTLTDEEINEVYEKFVTLLHHCGNEEPIYGIDSSDVDDFARAILRKAQGD